MPIPIASLQEASVKLSCRNTARFVPSDRPGYAALEIRTGVCADIEYSDVDPFADDPCTVTDTYQESRRVRNEHVEIVYLPLDAVQAVLNTELMRAAVATLMLPKELVGLTGSPPIAHESASEAVNSILRTKQITAYTA